MSQGCFTRLVLNLLTTNMSICLYLISNFNCVQNDNFWVFQIQIQKLSKWWKAWDMKGFWRSGTPKMTVFFKYTIHTLQIITVSRLFILWWNDPNVIISEQIITNKFYSKYEVIDLSKADPLIVKNINKAKESTPKDRKPYPETVNQRCAKEYIFSYRHHDLKRTHLCRSSK